ncbi:MAG TPA: 50S ribosomal protein L10 [Actinomycetota bacterium]|nr:50S ribosomal protein L10 [Actinomycetota bacterium]
MPSTQKMERVAELKERIEGSSALLLTEYRGLTVSEITELRRSLSDGGARFAVIKNTLMRRALEGTDAAGLDALFEGPSAVAFVEADPVAAAKSVTAAAKKFPTLILKGAFVEGRVLSADQAKALADLDSREVMLSKLAGLMKSELTRAAGSFQAAQARFLALLDAFKAKLPAEAEPLTTEDPEAPAATEEPETAAAETEDAAAPEKPGTNEATGDTTEDTTQQTIEADTSATEGEE